MNSTDPIAQTFQPFGEDWQSLPPAARKIGAGVGALSGLVIGIAVAVPFAVAMGVEPSGSVVMFIMASNAVPGILFGWLYWRWGLEAAMLAHALSHATAALAALARSAA